VPQTTEALRKKYNQLNCKNIQKEIERMAQPLIELTKKVDLGAKA